MHDIATTQAALARKALAVPDHRFGDLYHLICRPDWIEAALRRVLANAGSRTPGIDGMRRTHLQQDHARISLVQQLRADLKGGMYRPKPVRRIYIPKANGKQRPLGIPTIRDRVVQMLLKMLLEPIWESDFLNCSQGFRPGRRTMDSIRLCHSRITRRNKFFWVIEGDIKGCFDHINHTILLKLVRRRVRDRRVVGLVEAFLVAGAMEHGLFTRTEEGTPQGGVLSPLLANIYLHEFDRWWWEKYGKLSHSQKFKRRKAGVGNVVLTRYADDFVLLCNGPHAEALRVREEVRQFLWDELHLELSVEKTHVTHARDGFDFLGFHLRYRIPKNRRRWLRVVPSTKSIARLKHTIKDATRQKTFYQAPAEKVRSLNRILAGWNRYYEYCSATRIASKLSFWANDRLFRWLRKRHKKRARWVLRTYQHREQRGRHDRLNLAVPDERGELLFLYQLTDLHRKVYRARTPPHPYLADEPLAEPVADTAFPLHWEGRSTPEKAAWAELRVAVLARDGHRCTRCSSTERLHIHHIKEWRQGGQDVMENLTTLCEKCHQTTTRWGRPQGTQNRPKGSPRERDKGRGLRSQEIPSKR
jgi:RNA-directed DNA polymerase